MTDKLAEAILTIAIEWEVMHLLHKKGHRGSWPRDRFESCIDEALEEAGFDGHADWYQKNVLAEAEKIVERVAPSRAKTA